MGRLQHVLGWVFLLALSATAAHAQPFIFYRGIVNAASFAPQGLPNGSIARGSIFSIFGRNLGPAEGSTVSAFPLGTNFQGVSIEVCQNANCVAALPLFVSAAQINAIMPSNAPLGAVSVRVTFSGPASNFSPVTVVASSLGIFAINSGGFGPGVVQNFTPEALPVNSTQASARPGQTVIAWGTGLGAGLNADNVEPQFGDLPVDVDIWAGGKQVTVKRYSGRSPCCAGVDQIIFDLPTDTPIGCYVPLVVRADSSVSNTVTIAVTPDGSNACPESSDLITERVLSGGNVGDIALIRYSQDQRAFGAQFESITDIVAADFSEERGGPWAFHPAYSAPPIGTCSVSVLRGILGGRASASSVRTLNAGPQLNVNTGASAIAVTTDARSPNSFAQGLGVQLPGLNLPPPVLNSPNAVQVQSAGGPDVGGFAEAVEGAAAIQWTNREQIVEIDRANGVTVTWENSSPPSSVVAISGGAADAVTDSIVSFFCVLESSEGAFTVPSYVLSAVPPARARESQTQAWLALWGLSAISTHAFDAMGLDQGSLVNATVLSNSVRYR